MPVLAFLEELTVQVLWVSVTGWRTKRIKKDSRTFTPITDVNSESNVHCVTLTVAPSLMLIAFDFFPIWLLMLKPILETFLGAGGSAEVLSSSSYWSWSDLRLSAVPSTSTVLQETGLVFTLSPSSCGPAWSKTTHQGEHNAFAT